MVLIPRRCCLIVTTPRTGSWLLAEALQATDLVGEPQEYFGWEGFEAWSREFGLDTDASHLRFIEAAMAYGTTEDGIFSAKMHWSQLHRFVTRLRALPGSWPKEAGTILQEFFPDLHCVHLTRADTARQAISYWRAVQLRKWWDLGESRDPSTEPDPDFQQIRWCEEMLIEDERRWRALLDYHHDIPRLEVVYETIIEDLEHTVEEVLEFLEIPHGPIVLPPGRLRRQADERTEEWLTVYRALHDNLAALPEKWRWSGSAIVAVDDSGSTSWDATPGSESNRAPAYGS